MLSKRLKIQLPVLLHLWKAATIILIKNRKKEKDRIRNQFNIKSKANNKLFKNNLNNLCMLNLLQ